MPEWTTAQALELARQEAENGAYYRGIVDQIGDLFGVEARTADDGSVQDSVLRAKVFELVQGSKRRHDHLLGLWANMAAQAAVVAHWLELGDQRLSAQDGPAGGQLPSLSPAEWGSVYRACKAIASQKVVTVPDADQLTRDFQKACLDGCAEAGAEYAGLAVCQALRDLVAQLTPGDA